MDLKNTPPSKNFTDLTGDTPKANLMRFLGGLQAAIGWTASKHATGPAWVPPRQTQHDPAMQSKLNPTGKTDWPDVGAPDGGITGVTGVQQPTQHTDAELQAMVQAAFKDSPWFKEVMSKGKRK